jgi:hypothetical protein
MNNIFEKYYQKDFVDPFFEELARKHTQETIGNFVKYHTDEMFVQWMGMFPPPYLYEIWDRWVKLGMPN